mmetsp:Transcript_14700/g.25421  ORF Transcript_14700/g.25421 Transcript_14700/m.25421 type:complete len:380 (-) Transcript_14700:169-1308(-)
MDTLTFVAVSGSLFTGTNIKQHSATAKKPARHTSKNRIQCSSGTSDNGKKSSTVEQKPVFGNVQTPRKLDSVDTSQPGWVRRYESLLVGKGVIAENVKWSVPGMNVVPENFFEETVWKKCFQLDCKREKKPFSTLRSEAMSASRSFLPRRNILKNMIVQNMKEHKVTKLGQVRRLLPGETAFGEYKPAALAQTYYDNGCAACFVYPDDVHSGGSLSDVISVHVQDKSVPVLVYDWVVNAYNIFEFRAVGADGLVLSSAIFPKKDLEYLTKAVASQSMFCIVEVNSEKQLETVVELVEQGGNKAVDAVLIVDRDFDSTLQAKPWSATFELLGSTNVASMARKLRSMDIAIMTLVDQEKDLDEAMDEHTNSQCFDAIIVPK